MRVEHHEAHGELEDDAADTPDVAGLIPTWREEERVKRVLSESLSGNSPSSMTTSGAL